MNSYECYHCNNGCCQYTVTPYQNPNEQYGYHHHNKLINTKIKKAGSFVYDKNKNKILLVQSRGQMWGPPKGTMQENETPLECAVREVKEETGIDIDEKQFSGSVIIKSKALYYYIETSEENWNVLPQSHIKDNDANGIGWFNVDCLNELITENKITINQHCRILIRRIFNKDIIFNRKGHCKRLLEAST